MLLSPIALFAYKRPDHLIKALTALKANRLARESALHIFSDAPKTPHDREAVDRVRRIIRQVDGFARVTVYERTENVGLARSIIEGVTELSASHGSVIVLEDDLVVAPGFLNFMNQALQRYQRESQVMAVSGYMFPVEKMEQLGSTFFCRVPTSWGWATWDRAWKLLEKDSARLLADFRNKEQQEAFNLGGVYPYFEHLKLHAEGKLDVWGVRWYASMFRAGGLCLYPNAALAQNIGMDGSGSHCGRSDVFDVTLSTADSWVFPEKVAESAQATASIRSFLMHMNEVRPGSAIVDLASCLSRLVSKMKKIVHLVIRSRGA